MAIDCTAESLVASATCLACVPPHMVEYVKILLLREIAGLQALDASQLVALAAPLQSIPKDMLLPVQNALLCEIANL